MSMISLRPLITAQREGGFAYGAFNINSVAQIRAALEIHTQLRAPALLQGAELANGFMGGRADFFNSTLEDIQTGARNIGNAVRRISEEFPVPVVLHLDHGRSLESCKAAIAGGYTSVMIDGSALPYKDNVALTREVVRYAHPLGVSVEGELGVLAGVEDNVNHTESHYTNPLDAIDFFKKTGVDALAISYGTMHGARKGTNVKLRREIVIAIRECMMREGIDGMLVSHGSSVVPQYLVDDINSMGGDIRGTGGIPLEELRAVIACGIGKINVDTDIRLAVIRNLRELLQSCPDLLADATAMQIFELLQQNPALIDPRECLSPAMDAIVYGCDNASPQIKRLMCAVETGVLEIIGILVANFGSYGKAGVIQECVNMF